MDKRFYPESFRAWSDFHERHTEVFSTLADFMSDEEIDNAVGQQHDPGMDEFLIGESLDSFTALTLERAVRATIPEHSKRLGDTSMCRVEYGYMPGLEVEEEGEDEVATHEATHAARDGIKFRRVFVCEEYGTRRPCAIAMHKPTPSLTAHMLLRVMSRPPSFIDELLGRIAGSSSGHISAGGQTVEAVPGELGVVQAICHTYHRMITSGLEYGYVVLSGGLILLRVPEDEPRVLYYSWDLFPISPGRKRISKWPLNMGEFDPCNTPAAYLASLGLWACQAPARSPAWVDAAMRDLARWPAPYSGLPSPRSPAMLLAKGRLPMQVPRREFCSQACLLGLMRQLPLDDKCPNVQLHRDASDSLPYLMAVMQKQPLPSVSHPLTADQVQSLIIAQLDANMNSNCRPLDPDATDDIYGAFAQVFGLEVAGYGYTFLSKGVQAVHRKMLQDEAALYEALKDFQGRLVPVNLGLIDLVRPYPLSTGALVHHMMLLSDAGMSFGTMRELRLNGVNMPDVKNEEKRTMEELAKAGLRDTPGYNVAVAWNREVGRMMRTCFLKAFFVPPGSAPPGAPAAKRKISVFQEAMFGLEGRTKIPRIAADNWRITRGPDFLDD